MIKVEETGALSNFLIIENGELAEGKFTPIREFQYMFVIISVLILSILWACVKEYFSRLIKKPEEKEKYDQLKSYFRISGRKK